MNRMRKKSGKQFHSQYPQKKKRKKRKEPRYKLNQGNERPPSYGRIKVPEKQK
jgi:hypothetical protein